MKNCITVFLATIFLSFVAIATTAQEPIAEVPEAPHANPPSILVLINEAQPTQAIVYDTNGKWLSDIREIKIDIDLVGAGIMADCVLWKGVLRPATPKTMKAPVKEIKSISAEMFAERLSKLND